MRDRYSSHAAALRDALRHAVARGGMSSLSVLHQGVPFASTLTGTDATAQAARIRRQLDRLAPLARALLVIAYEPRSLKCSYGAYCCAGSYPNPEWEDAMRVTHAHIAPLLARHRASYKLRCAIVAIALICAKESALSLAECNGVNRHAIAAQVAIIETDSRASGAKTCWIEPARGRSLRSRDVTCARDEGVRASATRSGDCAGVHGVDGSARSSG
jgi:hypothetical protein